MWNGISSKARDHVEWKVEYKSLQENENCLWGPRIGHIDLLLGFQLKCTCTQQIIDLSLIVLSPCPNASSKHLLCWAGLKISGGIYYHRIQCTEIKNSEVMFEVTVLDSYFLSDLERHHLIQDGRLTFFLLLTLEQEPTTVQAYTNGVENIYWLIENMIQENIIAHDLVEWNVPYTALQKEGNCVFIPRFRFRNLSFKLICTCTRQTIDLSLQVFTFCQKHSSEYLLCWAGLKRSDGIYYHRIESTEIKAFQIDTVSVWDSCFLSDLERHHLINDGYIKFFLRLSVEPEPIKAHTCTNGVSDVLLPSVGRIRQDYIAYNHVEWDVDYKALLKNRSPGRPCFSPLFCISNQTFAFACSFNHSQIVLSLKQFTPPHQDSSQSVLCWQGLKRNNGTYHHIIECKELNLTKSYLSEGTTLGVYIRSEFEKQHLTPDGHLTFFLRLNAEQPLSRAETSTNGGLDISPRGIGNIVEEKWTSYTRVEWNVDWKPSPDYVNEDVSSPVFVIENQRYLWGLMRRSNDVTLCIFRMGPVVERFVQWWASVRLDNVTYPHQGSQCGKLDLNGEKCTLWAPIKKFERFTHFDGRIRFTVKFLMSLEQEPTAAETCIHVDFPSPKDFKLLETGDVIFLVKGKVLKSHRALLDIRVPALGANFLHDCIENRTGVVHIKDCEPFIFETFLNFIYSGDTREVTLNNVFPLYIVADKYLFEELKVECLKFIELHEEFLEPTFYTVDVL